MKGVYAIFAIAIAASTWQTSGTDAAQVSLVESELGSVVIDEAPWPKDTPGSLLFEPLSETLKGQIQIIGGFPIAESDFPATVRSPAVGGSCTASLIGPRVLLTAAHCVDKGFDQKQAQAAGAKMELGGKVRFNAEFDLNCTMHPAYAAAKAPSTTRPRTSEDWALCELSGTPAVTPETISTSGLTTEKTPYFILGFGCTGVQKVAGRLVPTDGGGSLLGGNDTLLAQGVGTSPGTQGHFGVSRSDVQEPSLCPGDSGGGVFEGPKLGELTGKRRVVMVNSALGSTGDGPSLKLYSYFASLSAPEFISFATGWVGTRPERRICGLQIKASMPPCRT